MGSAEAEVGWVELIQYVVVVTAASVSTVIDLRSKKIPNIITFPLIVSGLFFMALVGGFSGLGDSALGMLLLSLPFLLAFALRIGGAGDVKLMAGIGAWVGIQPGIWILLSTCIAGGVWSIVAMVIYGRVRELPYTFVALVTRMIPRSKSRLVAGGEAGVISEDGMANSLEEKKKAWLPYAPAILAGTVIGGVLWVVYGGF